MSIDDVPRKQLYHGPPASPREQQMAVAMCEIDGQEPYGVAIVSGPDGDDRRRGDTWELYVTEARKITACLRIMTFSN